MLSYSLLRKRLFIVDDTKTWGVHSVFRDCATIFCSSRNGGDFPVAGDLLVTAIALLLSSCLGIDKVCPLSQDNAYNKTSDSW